MSMLKVIEVLCESVKKYRINGKISFVLEG